ncbi:MAG: hypothetical protein ABI528_06615 [bacterium]
MRVKLILLIACLTFATISGCGVLSKRYTKSETVNFSISAQGKTKLKLDNTRGSVILTHSPDSGSIRVKVSKEIKVKKKFLNTPFNEIGIRIDSAANIVSITTELMSDDGEGVFRFNMGKDQRVDYEIQVPSNVELEIENVSGNITTNGLDNDLKIDLVNGDVSLEEYTGKLECEITNGSFSGRIDSTRGITVSTVNGSISLFLNNFMNADLRAETVNGRITDDNISFKEVIREKKLFKAKLGNGEPKIDIRVETVNGKIKFYGRNEV